MDTGLLGILHHPPGTLSTLLGQTGTVALPIRPSTPVRRAGPGAVSTGTGGAGKQRSAATRIAIARVARRARTKRHGGVLGLVMLMMLLAIVVVTGTAVLTAGSAATALIASLQEGLPDVKTFDQLRFSQPTRVYDRTGTHLLAQFFSEKRTVIKHFSDIPPLVVDATTVVEDRSFWQNQGYDLQSTVFASLADLTGAADRGGASTITQQLVRAVLLPKALLAPGADIYERKAKELIQSAKLTDAFPGEEGKQRIITAYLNQIFYGHNAYGIAAAAQAYFGKKMSELTLGQVALLAGLPQSPSNLDPYRYAKTTKRKGKTRIVVPTCTYGQDLQPTDPNCAVIAPVVRRDFILRALLDGFGRWTKVTKAEVVKAMNEPIVLAGDKPNPYKAPHYVVAVKQRLDQMFRDGEPVETGGYRVTTTLDWTAQRLAEKYVMAGAVLPNLRAKFLTARKALGIRAIDYAWINNLRASSIHNAALVAEDYRTGDILAYVGSADYYDKYHQKSAKFNPQFDVAGLGYRQPGSAWKPMVYTSAFEERVLTPGSVLLDITTPFAPGWRPSDADGFNRGPVLARYALQQSLNIPAIRTMSRLGNKALDQYTAKAGFTVPGGPPGDRQRRPGRRHRHRRGAGHRHGLRLRRLRERRAGDGAPLHPQGQGPVRQVGLLRGRTADQEGLEPSGRMAHGQHPVGQLRPQAEPVLGQELPAPQRARRPAADHGPQDRHHQRRQGRVHLRAPAAADQPEGDSPCRRCLDGQQQPRTRHISPASRSSPRTRRARSGGRSCATTPRAGPWSISSAPGASFGRPSTRSRVASRDRGPGRPSRSGSSRAPSRAAGARSTRLA